MSLSCLHSPKNGLLSLSSLADLALKSVKQGHLGVHDQLRLRECEPSSRWSEVARVSSISRDREQCWPS
jgi:hypothetical protein